MSAYNNPDNHDETTSYRKGRFYFSTQKLEIGRPDDHVARKQITHLQ